MARRFHDNDARALGIPTGGPQCRNHRTPSISVMLESMSPSVWQSGPTELAKHLLQVPNCSWLPVPLVYSQSQCRSSLHDKSPGLPAD